MLNLKGQAEKSNTYIDPSHQQRLTQAFATVLADQVADSRAEEAFAQQRREQLKNNEDAEDDKNDGESSSEIDFDEMDAELDKLDAARHHEMVTMNKELAFWKAKGNGVYDITTQDELMQKNFWDENQAVVLHFFHKDYERCKVIGQHLVKIAPLYYPVRFLSIDADKARFMVEKMQVQILPTLVFFKDGKLVDRLTGFTELGNKDDFTTAQLEKRMKQSGIMTKLKYHMTDEEHLEEDEKRNKKGQGTIYRTGGAHGLTSETTDE